MTMRSRAAVFISEIKFVALVIACMAVFRTTAFGMYHIPSESMMPTLQVGDRVAVSKFAYGYSRHSAPFSALPDFMTPDGRIFSRPAERGDIAVFKHPRTKDVMIKRIVALPGDSVALKEGRLYVNGTRISREPTGRYVYREYRGGVVAVDTYTEILPGTVDTKHKIFERSDFGFGDAMAPVIVPERHYFVMGDNRDNSVDSRFLKRGVGFVPADHLIGKAVAIPFSTHRCRREPGVQCRQTKWFSAL